MGVRRMEPVLVDVTEGVLTLTINRPDKRNAGDDTVLDGLEAGLRRAARDDGVRVVVLRGSGGYFSAGIDLPFAMGWPGERLTFLRIIGEVAIAIRKVPKPTISVIEGGAIGLSANLALACDLTL